MERDKILGKIIGNRKLLFPVSFLFISIVIAGLLRATKMEAPANPISERVWTVDTASVVIQNIQPTIDLLGEIVAGREVRLRALTSGAVESVGPNFKNGGTVRAGETLLQIDPFFRDKDLLWEEARLRESAARLDELLVKLDLEKLLLIEEKTQHELSQADLGRYNELGSDVVSARTLDQARLSASQAKEYVLLRQQRISVLETQIRQQKAVGERLQISVERAARVLSDAKLRAPFGGYLADISANKGMQLNAGDPVARLIDGERLEARIFLSNEQFARSFGVESVSKTATIKWNIGGELSVFEALVDRLASEVDPTLGGVHIYAELGPQVANTSLRPGVLVEVRVPDRIYHQVARLPEAVLHGREIVYVIENGRLSERKVEMLGRDGDWVLLKGDLSNGDTLATTRFTEIGPGVAVRTLP